VFAWRNFSLTWSTPRSLSFDHATLKHLIKKFDSKSYLIRRVLLQEFDLEIKDKARLANVVADHLSRLGYKATPSEELPIDDS